MPRRQQIQQVNNFIGGLNTESSPLNFPEGTAKSLDNVDLNRDGSIRRRPGVDYEISGGHSNITFAEATFQLDAISTADWTSVDGNDDLNFLVIQIGTFLHFHNLGKETLSLAIVSNIDLDVWKTDVEMSKEPMDFLPAKGKLFVVSRFLSPLYISYDQEVNRFTATKITVKIRDLEGIDESISSPIDTTTPDFGEPDDDIFDVLDDLPNGEAGDTEGNQPDLY